VLLFEEGLLERGVVTIRSGGTGASAATMFILTAHAMRRMYAVMRIDILTVTRDVYLLMKDITISNLVNRIQILTESLPPSTFANTHCDVFSSFEI